MKTTYSIPIYDPWIVEFSLDEDAPGVPGFEIRRFRGPRPDRPSERIPDYAMTSFAVALLRSEIGDVLADQILQRKRAKKAIVTKTSTPT